MRAASQPQGVKPENVSFVVKDGGTILGGRSGDNEGGADLVDEAPAILDGSGSEGSYNSARQDVDDASYPPDGTSTADPAGLEEESDHLIVVENDGKKPEDEMKTPWFERLLDRAFGNEKPELPIIAAGSYKLEEIVGSHIKYPTPSMAHYFENDLNKMADHASESLKSMVGALIHLDPKKHSFDSRLVFRVGVGALTCFERNARVAILHGQDLLKVVHPNYVLPVEAPFVAISLAGTVEVEDLQDDFVLLLDRRAAFSAVARGSTCANLTLVDKGRIASQIAYEATRGVFLEGLLDTPLLFADEAMGALALYWTNNGWSVDLQGPARGKRVIMCCLLAMGGLSYAEFSRFISTRPGDLMLAKRFGRTRRDPDKPDEMKTLIIIAPPGAGKTHHITANPEWGWLDGDTFVRWASKLPHESYLEKDLPKVAARDLRIAWWATHSHGVVMVNTQSEKVAELWLECADDVVFWLPDPALYEENLRSPGASEFQHRQVGTHKLHHSFAVTLGLRLFKTIDAVRGAFPDLAHNPQGAYKGFTSASIGVGIEPPPSPPDSEGRSWFTLHPAECDTIAGEGFGERHGVPMVTSEGGETSTTLTSIEAMFNPVRQLPALDGDIVEIFTQGDHTINELRSVALAESRAKAVLEEKEAHARDALSAAIEAHASLTSMLKDQQEGALQLEMALSDSKEQEKALQILLGKEKTKVASHEQMLTEANQKMGSQIKNAGDKARDEALAMVRIEAKEAIQRLESELSKAQGFGRRMASELKALRAKESDQARRCVKQEATQTRLAKEVLLLRQQVAAAQEQERQAKLAQFPPRSPRRATVGPANDWKTSTLAPFAATRFPFVPPDRQGAETGLLASGQARINTGVSAGVETSRVEPVRSTKLDFLLGNILIAATSGFLEEGLRGVITNADARVYASALIACSEAFFWAFSHNRNYYAAFYALFGHVVLSVIAEYTWVWLMMVLHIGINMFSVVYQGLKESEAVLADAPAPFVLAALGMLPRNLPARIKAALSSWRGRSKHAVAGYSDSLRPGLTRYVNWLKVVGVPVNYVVGDANRLEEEGALVERERPSLQAHPSRGTTEYSDVSDDRRFHAREGWFASTCVAIGDEPGPAAPKVHRVPSLFKAKLFSLERQIAHLEAHSSSQDYEEWLAIRFPNGVIPQTASSRRAIEASSHECEYNRPNGCERLSLTHISDDGHPSWVDSWFHRKKEPHFGCRCGVHNSWLPHQLSPGVCARIFGGGKVDPIFIETCAQVGGELRRLLHVSLPEGGTIALTSMDTKYRTKAPPKWQGFPLTLVIVPSGEKLPKRLVDDGTLVILRVPVYVNSRSLAHWRAIIPQLATDKHSFVIFNSDVAHLSFSPEPLIKRYMGEFDRFSICCWSFLPVNLSCMYWKGGDGRCLAGNLHAFEHFGFVYGSDELVHLAFGDVVAVYNLPGNRKLLHGRAEETDLPVNVTAIMTDGHKEIRYKFNNWDRGAQNQLIAQEDHGLGISRALDSSMTLNSPVSSLPGGLTVLGFMEYEMISMPPTPASRGDPMAMQDACGVVTFFCFGSEGDIRPIIYGASVLASHGFQILVVILNTPEEGRELVSAAERHEAWTVVPCYLRALRTVNQCQGIHFAPSNLPARRALPYTCSPPDDIIWPVRGGAGFLMDHVRLIIDSFRDTPVYVSAYNRRGHVPRGLGPNVKLERRRNLGVYKIGIRMGSSSARIPAQYRNVPEIPEGDDMKEFPKYETVVCHGGAGTVQTAAACGCRVIILSRALDRNYRIRDDAGKGVDPSKPSIAWLLIMLKVDIRFAKVYYRARLGRTWNLFALLWRWLAASYEMAAFLLNYQIVVFGFNFMALLVYFANHLWNNQWGYDVDMTIFLILLPTGAAVWARWFSAFGLKISVVIFKMYVGTDWKLAIFGARKAMVQALSCGLFIPAVAYFGLWGFPLASGLASASPFLFSVGNFYFAMLWRASKNPSLEEAPHGIYIEFWWTQNFALAIPVVHGRLIDFKRGIVYEGRHLVTPQLGAKFEAMHVPYDSSCEQDTKRKRVLLPTTLTPDRFDGLEHKRAPYHPLWNCMAIMFDSLSTKAMVEVDLTAAMVLAFASAYAAGLIAFGFAIVVTAWIIACVTAWCFSLGVPEWLDEAGMSVTTTFDPAANPSLNSTINKATIVGLSTLGGFGLVDEAKAAVDYLDLAVQDDRLRGRLADLGVDIDFRLHRSSMRAAASRAERYIVTQFENFNASVDRTVLDHEVQDTRENIDRSVYGSPVWTKWIEAKIDYLVTMSGAATALAFQSWAENEAENELAQGNTVVEDKIRSFEAAWPRGARYTTDYRVALAGFQMGLTETTAPDLILGLMHRLAPVPLSEVLSNGVSTPIREEITRIQSFRERSNAIFAKTADYKFRLQERFKDKATPVELELVVRVAEKGLSRDARQQHLLLDPEGLQAPVDLLFDLSLARLAHTANPTGLGYEEGDDEVLDGMLERMPAHERALLALMFHTPLAGVMDMELSGFLDSREESSATSTERHRVAVAQLGALVQMAVQTNFAEANALEAALITMKDVLEAEEMRENDETRRRAEVLAEIEKQHRAGKPPTAGETLVQWFVALTELTRRNQVWADALSVVATYVTQAEQVVLNYAVQLLDALLGGLMRLTENQDRTFLDAGLELAVRAADILALRLRVNPKVVWAPLYKRNRKPLTNAERLNLSITGPVGDSEGYARDLERTIEILEKHCENPDQMPELLRTYVRPVYRPAKAYGTQREFEGVHNAPQLVQDKLLEKRVASYATRGVRQGIDGVWLSDEQSNLTSLSRYEPDGYQVDPGLEALVLQCADAIFEEYPEMFTKPKLTSPQVVLDYIEKRYSPGIPFIGTYSTRAAMFNAGWGRAIIEASKECLRTGWYPEMQFHAFPKMQVVDKEKLFAGKPVRTVVSQDLLTVFLDHILFLERNKRPASLNVGLASGRPLTEAGMRGFFEAVVSHKRFFKADEREYDSRTPPVIFSGLTRLASLGMDKEANASAKKAWVAKRYHKLQQAHVTELEGGKTVRKRRGGATGQSGTTWDNSWGVKLKAMASYCIVTGRSPKEFFTHNVFVNQSDDNMWGTNDDSFNPHDLVQVYDQFFGGELDIESMDNQAELMFLGKMIEPGANHTADYELVGAPVPRFAIKADVSNLLMRRSAFTTRVAGFKTEQHMRSRLQRTVGHGLLCAHNRPLFTEMAKEWMEDARVYLRRSKGQDLFHVVVDNDGYILDAKLKESIKPVSRADTPRLNFLKKMGRLVGYVDILRAELAEVEVEKLEARHSKLLKMDARISTSVGEYSRLLLGTLRQSVIVGTPPWVLALDSEPDLDTGLIPYFVPDYRAELFIYNSLVNDVEDPESITLASLLSRAKEAPYRYVLDIPGFWYYRTTTEGRARLSAITRAEAQNYVVTMTIFYAVLNTSIEQLARKYDVFNAALEAYNVITLDLPRIYSVANTVHWHLTGRSSIGISSCQPKDPYIAFKQAARMAAFVTRHLVPNNNLPLKYQKRIAEALDMAGRFIAFGPTRKAVTDISKASSRLAEWMSTAEIFADSLETDAPYQILQAKTGVGKSTYFIAALSRILALRSGKKVWLVVPRNILRDNYTNQDIGADDIIKISRDTVVMGQALVVSTYGSLLARLARLDTNEYLLACDEFHEGTPEQVAVEFKTRAFERIFISATPRLNMFPTLTKVLQAPLEPKYQVTDVPMNRSPLNLFLEFKRLHPDKAERALVQVPTLREANEVAQQLQSTGSLVTVLSRYNTTPSPVGVIVATQVADSGITINPPPNVVISSRDAIVSHKGATRRMPLSSAALAQRRGRTGRLGDGWCYYHPDAGNGIDAEPYPAWGLYISEQPLQAHFTELHQIKAVLGRTPGEHYEATEGNDPTRIVFDKIERELEHLQIATILSLRAYYAIFSFTQDHGEAKRIYIDGTVKGIFAEAIAPVEGYFRRLMERDQLLTYEDLRSRLDNNPFTTMIAGKRYDHCGIILWNNDIVPCGTPGNPMNRR